MAHAAKPLVSITSTGSARGTDSRSLADSQAETHRKCLFRVYYSSFPAVALVGARSASSAMKSNENKTRSMKLAQTCSLQKDYSSKKHNYLLKQSASVKGRSKA